MLETNQKQKVLNQLIEVLELPRSAYEKARERYEDLGSFLIHPDSAIAQYEPHIHPQGSFRIGTAIKPINNNDEYDLDITCKFQEGILKTSHSQAELKELLRNALESYIDQLYINHGIESKHRCLRIKYEDHISFHMDIVPCIPETDTVQKNLQAKLLESRMDEHLILPISRHSVAITDDRKRSFNQISEDWEISNPEGYALWFESRMRLASDYLRKKADLLETASMDDIPTFQWNSPLQKVIQLLKRHRDVMFTTDKTHKPVSIIITTLAAKVYNGETEIDLALENILNSMSELLKSNNFRIVNPVNPSEVFTDKWTSDPVLKDRFLDWIDTAKADYEILFSREDPSFIVKQSDIIFDLKLEEKVIITAIGAVSSSVNYYHPPHILEANPPKPWGNAK